MEDCCAVCAEPLEFIAYGPCGHKEVCSTCTVRLRVVLDDDRCCICTQRCPFVFVTKAMGEFTKVISSFDDLPRMGMWFDADIGAYFDDEDEFKRIKAMCKLQCKVCETAPEGSPVQGAVKKGHVFRNLDGLRRHIYSAHKLVMCSLCLEGRKTFIQDQKLYTKGQLERHSSRGDSKVDGNEEERGGFSGHPMCAFCNRRFYSDNELYHHMSTEHFTCHLCQRLSPGQFEYYQNYDDLEGHFRTGHFLCEDPECLAKKFMVFASEHELKIHNAKEHGGSLTRAQRNAALKIPVSYQFRRSGPASGSGSGRGGSYSRGSRVNNDFNAELFTRESSDPSPSEAAVDDPAHDTLATTSENFPALAQSEAPPVSSTDNSRWVTAIHGGTQRSLNESAFPPLPGASQTQQVRQPNQRPLAALFNRGAGKVKVLNAADKRQLAVPSETRPPESRSNDTSAYPELRVSRANGISNPSEYPDLRGNRIANASDYPELQVSRVGHSGSAVTAWGPPPVASRGGPSYPSSSASSSSSSTGTRHAEASTVQLSMDEIRAATKVLQERIRAHLKGDEQQFATFKEVHSQFRSGDVSAKEYYDRVAMLGLSDILPELARLCPDPKKQQDLLAVIKRSKSTVTSGRNGYRENGSPAEPEVEVLSTDGYRRTPNTAFPSRPSRAMPAVPSSSSSDWTCSKCTLVNSSGSGHCAACGSGRGLDDTKKADDTEDVKKKKKKPAKVPKFLRNRLGDVGEDQTESSGGVEPPPPSDGGSVRGAWRNNGGQRLVTSAWNRAG